MNRLEPWHYTDVPGLGTVIFSQKAVDSLHRDAVSDEDLVFTLVMGTDHKDATVLHGGWRRYQDIELVLRTRPSMPGAAAVCIDGYRVKS